MLRKIADFCIGVVLLPLQIVLLLYVMFAGLIQDVFPDNQM